MVPVNNGSGMSQGEDSDAFLMSFNLLRGIDAESSGARVIPPCDNVRNFVSSQPCSSPLLHEFHCFFASLCQAWTMSAMKTSSPIPPLIRFLSSMSSLKDFFSMTRQKVISLRKRNWKGKTLSSKIVS